jgi:WhiB family redox-sensing transcriptional regulator
VGDWMQQAHCKETETRVFFIYREDKDQRQRREHAYEICRWCPVKADCLEYAIVNNEIGIWGGTTDQERRRMRRHWIFKTTPRKRPRDYSPNV